MKNKHIKWMIGTALTAVLLTGSSCKKILDLQPHTTTFTEAYFRTGQDANTGIAGAYALLRNIMLTNNSWHVYGDIPSGALNIQADAFHQQIQYGNFIGINVGSDNWNWSGYYQLLQQINLVIKKVPDIPIESFIDRDEKARIIGEAYFLRAFTYFYMSRIWGDVPLKLEPDLDISQALNIPRTPAATIWAQCLADCDRAEQGLVFGYADPAQTAVRANKGSLLALKAHIQAWKGDYAACEKTADSVITYGGYTLLDSSDYKQIFIGKSSEGIFEINVNYSQNEGQATLNNQSAYWPTLAMPYVNYRSNPDWATNRPFIENIYHSLDSLNSLDDTLHDFRYRTIYFHDQTIKYANIVYADGSAHNDPRLSNNLNIFRLADIILLRAEALDSLHRPDEALPLLNRVRERAGIPAYDPNKEHWEHPPLKTLILKERLKELYFEGHAYYDLIRTGTLLDFNDNFQESQYRKGGWLWPVDPGMFKDDFTLTQTPYWIGKL